MPASVFRWARGIPLAGYARLLGPVGVLAQADLQEEQEDRACQTTQHQGGCQQLADQPVQKEGAGQPGEDQKGGRAKGGNPTAWSHGSTITPAGTGPPRA